MTDELLVCEHGVSSKFLRRNQTRGNILTLNDQLCLSPA